MTILGFAGLDIASLVVWNILNPETTEYPSTRLRIGLYGIQTVGLISLVSSGWFAGPEVSVILVEGIMCSCCQT